ncbi:glycosyltransferase family 1 protein [Chitinispirillales bacterium ANBcel5]|uniref:glycosyltransferase family 4 protein n=1 Tax=Cellulosispirillum alkaliphilum TaxID=3039283 RepID=UPI002A528435|nr:glycosyltransferase family 1 protein [Chitinispirillales bacterium ANBcel5]
MQIGIDIKTLRNKRAGIQNYVIELLDKLQSIDTQNNYILYEPSKTDYTIKNRKWKRVLIRSRLPGTLWMQFRLPRRVKKDNVDVLWCPEGISPLRKIKGCKIITSIHDFTFIHYPHTMRKWSFLMLKLFSRRTFSISDMITTNSNFTKRELFSLYNQVILPPVRTVPCGSPYWSKPGDYRPEKRSNHLLFVGSIEPRKNIVKLIEAMENLKSRGLIVPLHIIGLRGWKNSSVKEKIMHSSCRDTLILKGYLTESQLKAEYLNCKAFIFPSIYEGFGLPVLEAISLDCLVLTSKDTVMQEVAKEHALYFDPKDPLDIANAIWKIYEDRFDRTKYLKRSNKLLKEYSWDNSAEKLLLLFKSCLSR